MIKITLNPSLAIINVVDFGTFNDMLQGIQKKKNAMYMLSAYPCFDEGLVFSASSSPTSSEGEASDA